MTAGKSETGVVRRFLKKDFSVLHTYSGKALRKYAVPGLKKYIVNFTPQQNIRNKKERAFDPLPFCKDYASSTLTISLPL